MKPKLLFEQLIARKNLDPLQMQAVMHSCITGEYSDCQIATFLALMRVKGETTQELTIAAQFMQSHAYSIDLGNNLMDIVGTGGDLKNTFNISTTTCFVLAAAGIPVAKHGNRAVSSRSGSADVLEHAGFKLQLTDSDIQMCLKKCNLAFLFAPHFHPGMKHVRTAREQLGIRTFFNLLGPLINPANVKRQVVGVFSSHWLRPLSQVLSQLGSERSLLINADDGLDEVSIAAPTQVLEYNLGQVSTWEIRPEDYGLKHQSLDNIIVDSPAQSLIMIQDVLKGKQGPARDIVLLNAAAAIYCAKDNLSFVHALDQAKMAIDEGKALACFYKLRDLTQSFSDKNP
ncbi:MAG: anthranilate phosphoribosyltransferase [Legionella sp.]|nr:anthranilate phosphoribosyltransferase [Legionella sp.]